MVVTSPVELYTVYLGWHQYDVLWDACKAFGLAWLPFLGLFYKNLTVPFEYPFGNGADTSLRRVFIELILMVVVLTFCVNPWITLTTNDIHYKPVCQAESVDSTLGNTGTTYDNVFGSEIHDNVKVPALFALVADWSSGFTNAAIATALPCTSSYSLLMHTIETSRLRDETAKSVYQFNESCYLQARSNFLANPPDKQRYNSILKAYGGPSDLTWMGSHVLRELYYKKLKAYGAGVVNFPYDQYPLDTEDDAIKQGVDKPKWGYPDCETWWSDPSHGLEHQIVADIDGQGATNPHYQKPSTSTQVNAWVHQVHLPFTSKMTPDDIMARGVLYNSKWNYGGFTADKAHVDISGNSSEARSQVSEVLIWLGQTTKRFLKTPLDREALSDVLPIAQAVILFLVLLFMPFVLIFGGYRMNVVMGLAFVLFAIIFLNYIWYAINYLENSLLDAVSDPMFGNLDTQHATIINLMTGLYCAAPIFFLSLMSIAGVKVGNALSNAISSAGMESSNVSAGAAKIQSGVISTAVNAAKAGVLA